ncbi:hypothetical protein J1N35_037427 [Gossypium stocksii]|uniref:Uncharacterized protein n=1 Tax=Gossypium stocksii TaxID=47602 RepID=A0A9D3UK72_9ROSI|nr:hypothetical protein J1N35_037427 [Gossypium stocksii]
MVICEPRKFIDLNFCKTEGGLSRWVGIGSDGDGRGLGSFVSSPSWSDELSLTSPKAVAPELLKEKVEEK